VQFMQPGHCGAAAAARAGGPGGVGTCSPYVPLGKADGAMSLSSYV
jgi:hypothetical protein